MAQQDKEGKRRERGSKLHLALAETHDLDFSIDKTLFDGVLNDERYREWQSSNDTWQLRFSGSPGCGKTTISSIIVEKLRENVSCVASIYLQHEVALYEAAFVEDFLWAIYTQLAKYVPDSTSNLNKKEDHRIQYDKYVVACMAQQPGPQRASLIRSALQATVPALPKPAFLVVDGIDCCSSETSVSIEEEISHMQHQGVKIMTTSRVPWIEESWTAAQCDGQECSAKSPRPWIHVYWACEDCMQHTDKERRGTTVFCRACWPEKAECIGCNNTTRFKQPFERIDFNISKIPDQAMSNFVRCAIQQEHGDVGLDSLSTLEGSETLSPSFTSSLGIQMWRSHNGMAERVVRDIVDRAQGNTALAHKRLELLHSAWSVDAFLAPRDRLPATIVDMFDAGLRGVEAQGHRERTLGLQAIAIVGRSDNGVPFADFQRLAQRCGEQDQDEGGGVLDNGNPVERFNLEDVLHAAKGLVIGQTDRWRGPRLMAFHPDFYLYCGQRYREAIVRANNSLMELP